MTELSVSNLCSTQVCQEAREALAANPQALTNIAVDTAVTFAWYAMPDLIRSRAARTVAKVALLGAMGNRLTQMVDVEDEEFVLPQADAVDEDLPTEVAVDQALLEETDPVSDDCCEQADGCCGGANGCGCDEGTAAVDIIEGIKSDPARYAPVVAATLGVAGAAVALTVACEKWLFRRGEARRAAGVPLAHTRQALGLSLLTLGASAAMEYATSKALVAVEARYVGDVEA